MAKIGRRTGRRRRRGQAALRGEVAARRWIGLRSTAREQGGRTQGDAISIAYLTIVIYPLKPKRPQKHMLKTACATFHTIITPTPSNAAQKLVCAFCRHFGERSAQPIGLSSGCAPPRLQGASFICPLFTWRFSARFRFAQPNLQSRLGPHRYRRCSDTWRFMEVTVVLCHAQPLPVNSGRG